LVEEILNSPEVFATMVKEENFEAFCKIFDEYHESLDKKMEQDKQDRKDLRELFKNIELGLKELREESKPLPLEDLPKRDYVKVNIGGKWVNTKPKRLGQFSIIEQVDKNER